MWMGCTTSAMTAPSAVDTGMSVTLGVRRCEIAMATIWMGNEGVLPGYRHAPGRKMDDNCESNPADLHRACG